MNILCIAASPLGRPFMLEAHRLGHTVYLLTTEKRLKEEWPRDKLADVFAVPDLYDEPVVRKVVSYLARDIKFDRIVPMGDWEMEGAAFLREHFRIPGMGETTMRYFRDKLAMRVRAKEVGIAIPEFTPLFNWKEIHEFIDRVPAPWILKPRQESASLGMSRIDRKEDLWPKLDQLGDKMSLNLLEKFIPGDLYHVDGVVHDDCNVVYASASRYGIPMLQLNTQGGMFTTRMLERGTPDETAIQDINRQVVKALGLKRGVTHIEFLKNPEDGRFYFLEAGARVGAARIADVVWHASGICLWHEWAKIEINQGPSPLPAPRPEYGGAVFTLARTENPDLSSFDAPEIVYRQARKWHAGLVVKSPNQRRVEELLTDYAERFQRDFTAHTPRKPRT
jgi:phosphoribosylaminoimidazole carboxylase (NCAIR synthetase)